ncbi:hypothetical protein CMV30_06200 [Nibricoccus aquaticus]|uniref:Uncharacterized protein n=1 Tax=Nibricoccus aquaticus TaxID=2576891 RepID=A0A290Q5M8_9BACT|nr:hypothetical protein [Nibricoccus aquaticus]ATC63577.1 hypothetical protein CMV30_06200 [Nibricoccus aquaticus]
MPTPPWRKPKPTEKSSVKLTPESIAWAKASAKKAGRRYPNLVDNMAATRRQLEQSQPPETPGPHIG